MANTNAGRGKAPRMRIEVPSTPSVAQPAVSKPATASVKPTVSSARPTVRVGSAAPEQRSAHVQAPKASTTAVVQPHVSTAAPKAGVAKDSQPAATPKPRPQATVQTTEYPHDEPSRYSMPREEHAEVQAPSSREGSRTQRVTAARDSAAGWVHRTFPGHENAFMGGLVALLVALLVFVIGLWRVLFIALLVVVGVAFGQVLDGDPKIVRTIRELLSSDREQR